MVVENGCLSEISLQVLQENIRMQNLNFSEWEKADSHLKSSFVLIQNFKGNESVINNWKTKLFREEGDYDYHIFINGPWHSLSNGFTNEGLEIKGKIITLPCKVTLRALAVAIKIRIKLCFHSSFFILPRIVDEISSETPVVKIVKDANLRGIFVVFGTINPATHKFRFIKQNQIPEQNVSPNNSRELEIEMIDNGDDKIFLNISSFENVKSILCTNLACSGFVPQLSESQVYFAGYGDSAIVKSISIQYRERILQSSKVKRAPECTCNII